MKHQHVTEGEITGQYAPTNQLLVPEEEPKQSSIRSGQQGSVIKMDSQVDRSKLGLADIGSTVTPGVTDNLPQTGNRDQPHVGAPGVVEPFDPRRVAKSIVSSMLGNIRTPAISGKLFNRDKNGNVIVPGLDTPTQRDAKLHNAELVRTILSKP